MPRLALAVPCFNEERRLDADAFTAYARAHPDIELILIDDGSTDGTLRVLHGIAEAAGSGVTVLPLRHNHGKAEAVRRGLEAAFALNPTWFGYWDADLSTPLEEVEAFRHVLESNPSLWVVLGSRVKLLGRDIQRKALRHYTGRIFATCASLVLDLPVYDTQCGAKLFRSSPATRWLFRRPFFSRWLFDVEILARLGLFGRRQAAERVHEHPLPVWRHVAGSKLRLWDFVAAAFDLVRVHVRYRCGVRRRRRPV